MSHPELAHGIMERVTSFFIEHSQKILSAAKGGNRTDAAK